MPRFKYYAGPVLSIEVRQRIKLFVQKRREHGNRADGIWRQAVHHWPRLDHETFADILSELDAESHRRQNGRAAG